MLLNITVLFLVRHTLDLDYYIVGSATYMDIRNGYKACGRNLQGHI